jgi:C-terminal processing protease CtpA/Prc
MADLFNLDVQIFVAIVAYLQVAVGSPVDGELHRGDIILEIQNQNAAQMTHKQAQEAIRNAGGSLVLRVKR